MVAKKNKTTAKPIRLNKNIWGVDMLMYSKRLDKLLNLCDAFVEQCTLEYNAWRSKNSCSLKEYILWQAEQTNQSPDF